MGSTAVKQYLDDNGNAIAAPAKQYLDDNGNVIASAMSAAPSATVIAASPAPQTPAIQPEARTFGNYASEIVHGVGRGLKNNVVGLGQMLAHPDQTISEGYKQADLADAAAAKEWRDLQGQPLLQRIGATALTGIENAPFIGGMVQHAEQGGDRMASPEAAGAAAEGITTLAAPELVGKAVGAVAKGIKPDVIRSNPEAVKGLVEDTQADNEKAVADADKKNASAVQKVNQKNADAVAKAAKENADAAIARQAQIKAVGEKVADVREENAAKEGVASRKEALNRGVERLDVQFQNDLKDTEKSVRTQAKAKYDAISEATKGQTIAATDLQAAVRKAQENIQGSSESIKQFNDIIRKSPEEGTFNVSGPMTFKDLQGYYSELGSKLAAGNLPGDVYTAMKSLRSSIDGYMQGMADDAGVGPQLKDARNYYAQYSNDFRDPSSPIYKAIQAQERGKSIAALAGKDQTGIEALARHNPELAQRANILRKYQAEANSLKPSSTRAEEPTLPPRQPTVQPSITPQPTPIEANANGITPGEVRVAKAEALANKADRIQQGGGHMANAFVALDVIRNAIHGNMEGIAVDLAARGVYGLGRRGVAKLLRNPKVVDFLSKPTPEDLALIPTDLRRDFPEIIEAAEANGIKVAPRLKTAFKAAAMTGPMTKQLQALRDGQRQPSR